MNSMADKNYFAVIFKLVIFYLSLVMVFEQDIRSIGVPEDTPIKAFNLFSTIYIMDIGLLLPIVIVGFSGLSNILIRENKLLYFTFAIYLYGLFLFFINGNPTTNIGLDLRLCLALFSGLCLVALLPRNNYKIVINIVIVELCFLTLTALNLLFLPDAMWANDFYRTTSPAAFSLICLPVIFIGPSLVYAAILKNKKLSLMIWLNTGILFFISVVVLQTRSLVIAELISIVIALLVIRSLSFKPQAKIKKNKSSKTFLIGLIFIISFALILLNYFGSGVDAFIDRMINITELEDDVGIAPRLAELPIIFESMSLTNHIFGVGLNPESILTDWQGNSYNASHFGIINIWWRFGAPVFLIIIFLYFISLGRAIRVLFLIRRIEMTPKFLMDIVCLPGLASAFSTALMSGGWGLASMLNLGLWWGIHRTGSRLDLSNFYKSK